MLAVHAVFVLTSGLLNLDHAFKTVKQFLDTMVKEAGSRKIVFSDEDEASDNPFAD